MNTQYLFQNHKGVYVWWTEEDLLPPLSNKPLWPRPSGKSLEQQFHLLKVRHTALLSNIIQWFKRRQGFGQFIYFIYIVTPEQPQK